MRFAAVQGYHALKKQLISTLTAQQVPHAQLFWGPEGNPGLSLALAFVTYLNCEQRTAEDACGECSSCLQMQKLVHPNVKFVFPTSATKQLTGKDVVSTNFLPLWRDFVHANPYGQVEDWSRYLDSAGKQLSIGREEAREVLQNVSLKAFNDRHKVTLIWLPEYLHNTAANALLKVIEEPPPHTLFLLVSYNPDKVLDTIRSRTQQVYIPAFTDEALAGMLREQGMSDQEQLRQVTVLADGNLNRAFKLAKQMEGAYFSTFQTWMRLCYAHDFTQLLVQADNFQAWSKVEQRDFLAYALHLLREAVVLYFTETTLSRITAVEQVFTQKLRKTLTHRQLKTWIDRLNQSCYYLERNVNPRMLYLDLSLRLAYSFKQ
ncbi:MAG: DNA polymerase III subunit delta [Bacteroidota bacterium]